MNLNSLIFVGNGNLPFSYSKSLFPTSMNRCVNEKLFLAYYDKLLPTFARDISDTEKCGWTEIDLHTYLIEGITVGGHTVRDEIVVNNVKEAWDFGKFAVGNVEEPTITKAYISTVHNALMKELLDKSEIGTFRKGAVKITGADNWKALVSPRLEESFEHEIKIIAALSNGLERAIIAQLWLSYRQYFIDGNKRVARLICNTALAQTMSGIFAIPQKAHSLFAYKLCNFYNTANADEIIKFILEYCLFTFDEDGYLELPRREL